MNPSSLSVNSLLSNLKSTVELLVHFRADSLTTQYGAIERLRLAILAILTHGLQQKSSDLYEQLWQIIVRLNANSQRYIHLLQEIYHKDNIRLSVEQWIDQSVLSQCLSAQLSCANNDPDLLQQYYAPSAFMRNPAFYQSLLVCLRTVENNDPSLLIDINPKLCLTGFSPIEKQSEGKLHDPHIQQRIVHRRIHSDPLFPNPKDPSNFNSHRVLSPTPTIFYPDHDQSSQVPESTPSISYLPSDECDSYASSYDSRSEIYDGNKQPIANAETLHNRHSISSEITLINEQEDNAYENRLSPIHNHDETSSISPTESSHDHSTRTTRLPHSSLFWPRKGQSLDNYIRECDLKTRTDVEKENAHFYFSEAIISAFEQIKFTQQYSKHLNQSCSSSVAHMLSPCETVHMSSSNSSSSPPSQYIPCNAKLISESCTKQEHSELAENEQHSEILESTTESNEAPNTFDWSTRSSILSLNLQESSAEAIALALMETWKNYKVPTAPELFWMIPHDEDLPQQPLPLPDGIFVDPSDDYLSNEDGQRILCRGNNQWAPPREQLIFHIHPSISRDVQLKLQKYLCAGCGRHVEKAYASRFRYCEYTGKYFCRSCHSEKRSFLPSYILTKWDFSSKHSVSNFAFDYLNRIHTDPSFNLNDLNPKLFEKSKPLKLVNDYRWVLFYLRHYVLTCRFAAERDYPQMLQKLSTYMYANPDVYSLHDLFKTKSGDLAKVLEPIVSNLREHVLQCPLCSAKGHICEICNEEKDIIFPFELDSTSVCQTCQSCYHFQCHENNQYQCPKCQRTKNRISQSSSNRSTTPTNHSQEDHTRS